MDVNSEPHERNAEYRNWCEAERKGGAEKGAEMDAEMDAEKDAEKDAERTVERVAASRQTGVVAISVAGVGEGESCTKVPDPTALGVAEAESPV